MKNTSFVLFILMACVKMSSAQTTLYKSNFDKGVYGRDDASGLSFKWSTNDSLLPNGARINTTYSPGLKKYYLGRFGKQTLSLAFEKPIVADSLTISFDFYAIGSWDGIYSIGGDVGPDEWSANLNGDTTLLDATFSNITDSNFNNRHRNQSYPHPYGTADTLPQSGAISSPNSNPLQDSFGSAIYHLTFTIPNPGRFSPLTLNFVSKNHWSSGFNITNDENWGIDSIQVISYSSTSSSSSCDSITVIPDSVNFGIRPYGVDSSMILTLRNESSTAVKLTGAVVIGNSWDQFEMLGMSIPTAIPPRTETSFLIRYTAANANRTDTAILKLSFNGDSIPCKSILLLGGVIPWPDSLVVSPSVIDFGIRCKNDAYTASITVQNNYSFPVSIIGDTILGAGAGYFSSANIVQRPYSLAPLGRSTFEFTVKYKAEGLLDAIDSATLYLTFSGELTASGEPNQQTRHSVSLLGKSINCLAVQECESGAPQAVTITPNPSYDHVVVSLAKPIGERAHYAIADVMGRIVKSGESEEDDLIIPTRNFPSGLYTLSLEVSNHMSSKHFLVIR